jgi:hypothetical protein
MGQRVSPSHATPEGPGGTAANAPAVLAGHQLEAAALARLSEDELFRDPFADFSPSER